MRRSIRFLSIAVCFTIGLSGQVYAQQVWSTTLDSINSFSSPRVADLNGDGVDDVVIGGGLEGTYSAKGIVAMNGADGSVMWESEARNQMFASPVFLDIDGIGSTDVIMAGRDALLVALAGDNGQVLWEAYPDTTIIDSIGRHNFYTGQIIPDQNNDLKPDILITFGGGAAGEEGPNETERPPGHIMVFSGLDGEELAKMVVPDSAETFSSLVVNDFGTGELWAVYGTGGETLPGGIWRTSLSDILAEFPDNSQLLHQSDSNGYVAPPALADLTGDGIMDVIANNHAGHIAAVNGATGSLIWERLVVNGETSPSPCIGRFNADATPDVSTVVAIGVWPQYTDYVRLTLNGVDGSTLDSTSLSDWNLSSLLAADLNSDGVDEIISAFNGQHYNSVLDTMIYTVTVSATDPTTWLPVYEYGPITGANAIYTPHISDMDDNGSIDVVYVSTEDSLFFISDAGMVVKRIELSIAAPADIAWGSYMGTEHDGTYHPPVLVGSNVSSSLNLNINASEFPGRVYNGLGALQAENVRNEAQLQETVNRLPAGVYFYQSNSGRLSESRKLVTPYRR